MFCMFPNSKSEWKKEATGQIFIPKEITTCRIGTLAKQVEDRYITTLNSKKKIQNPFECTKIDTPECHLTHPLTQK